MTGLPDRTCCPRAAGPAASPAMPRRDDVIRRASASDEARIRDCTEQAYARYVPLIGRRPAPMNADFAALIAAGDVYVAMDDRESFQGFVAFYTENDHVQLEIIAVLPTLAGQGIGRTLVDFCEETARRRGANAVHLYTNEKMVENLSIYPRLGYVEVARRTEDGFNRVYFEKSLT